MTGAINYCQNIGCLNQVALGGLHCGACITKAGTRLEAKKTAIAEEKPISPLQSLAEKYPKYYKKVGGLTEIDVYAVHHLFNIQDASGAIHHASKKLLLSGVRTGGKSKFQDIREARDTLNRWLELNPE